MDLDVATNFVSFESWEGMRSERDIDQCERIQRMMNSSII